MDHRVLINSRVLAACFTLVAGSASAQDCFLFFCPPPPIERVEPLEPYEPAPVAPAYPRGPYRGGQTYQDDPYYQGAPPPAYPRAPSNQAAPVYDPSMRQYSAIYAAVAGEPYPVPAVPLSQVNPAYLRRVVSYPSNEPPGTIIIDPQSHYLYLIQGGGRAMRYGVGVGRQGFGWSGVATIRDKQAWPDWYPPKEMIQRQPELRRQLSQLRSGVGLAGGPGNPLGARAMYLWQGGRDTLYRIHGTNEPHTIGQSVSSGCIRMLNQDVIDLFQRTPVGAKVVVLSSRVSDVR